MSRKLLRKATFFVLRNNGHLMRPPPSRHGLHRGKFSTEARSPSRKPPLYTSIARSKALDEIYTSTSSFSRYRDPNGHHPPQRHRAANRPRATTSATPKPARQTESTCLQVQKAHWRKEQAKLYSATKFQLLGRLPRRARHLSKSTTTLVISRRADSASAADQPQRSSQTGDCLR